MPLLRYDAQNKNHCWKVPTTSVSTTFPLKIQLRVDVPFVASTVLLREQGIIKQVLVL